MKRLFLDLGEYGHLTGRGVPIQQWHDHGQGLIRTILHAAGLPTDLASRRLCANLQQLAPLLRGYDMLLMNVRSYTFPGAREAAKVFKRFNPEGVVIVGGMHATVDLSAMEAVEEFDHIVQGGGENVIVSLVRDHTAFARVIVGRQSKSMAEWPMIDRTLWPKEAGAAHRVGTWPLEADCGWGPPPVATIMTSRVCPFRCNFSVTGDARIPIRGLGIVRMDALEAHAASRLAMAVGGGSIAALPMHVSAAVDVGHASTSYWVDEGPANVVTVTLQNGLSLTATPNHRVRAVRQGKYVWIEAGNLVKGDWIPVQHSTEAYGQEQSFEVPWTTRGQHPSSQRFTLDADMGWLLGYFVGNGALHRWSRAASWCARLHLVEKVARLAEKCLGKKPLVLPLKQSAKVKNVQIGHRPAWTFLTETLGMGECKLRVPEAIFQSPREVMQAFVDGLFDADGYSPEHPSASYISTISEELARGVALLLLNLGKCPAIRKTRTPAGSLSRRPYHWRVYIHQVEDRIPVGKSAYVNKYKGSRYVGWRASLKGPGSTGVRRAMVEEIEPTHDLIARKQWYSQVVSVKDAGVQRVYDITVPGDECFIANGFVAHNCNEFAYIPNMDRRPVEAVIDELNHLDERYGPIGSVVIHDSMFFQNPPYLREWLDKYPRLARKPWPYWAAARADTVRKWPDLFEAVVKETNWTSVSIGFESGSDRVLKMLNKECTAEDNLFTIDLLNRIGDDLEAQGRERPRFWANVMYGIPGETPEDVFATKRMIRRMVNPMITPATYAPYPGSMLGYQITAEGKSYLGDQHFRFLGGEYMAGIDYKFLRDVEGGAYELDIEESEWLPGAEPKPLGPEDKRPPSKFWLFPLRNGKKRLAHGTTVEEAKSILAWRMSEEEMAQIADAPPIEIRQQDVHPYIKELG